MDKNEFQGKWNQLKGSIKETWGELTDDEIAQVDGKKDKLVGLLQETYGESKENVEKKIDELLKKLK